MGVVLCCSGITLFKKAGKIMGLFGKIIGLFRKKKISKVAEIDLKIIETVFDSIQGPSLGEKYDELMKQSMLMDMEFNASVVECKKCGNKFTMNDGWRLFRGMAKESVIKDSDYRNTLMCGDCFSIFAYRHDYKHVKIELTHDKTHEKEKLLQEKYL
ncbi:MAG: hypothetical protein LBP92_06435 [Deltaproteobacteria bacterium]|nr:hypothetical protein [Deltaproteobacteria bacterium]